jgi:hypothetical protein
MFNQTSHTEMRRPAQSHIDINALRPNGKERAAWMAAGVVIVAVGFVPVQFGLLVSSAYVWTGAHWVGLIGLFSLASILFGVGVYCLLLPIGREWQFNRWASKANTVALANQQAVGIETLTKTDSFTLRHNDPVAALGVAVLIHYHAQQGKAVYTVDELADTEGWLGQTRLGKIPQSQAARLLRVYAQMGLLTERQPKRAGAWLADDYGAVVEAFARRWGKVKWNEVG